MLKKSYSKTGKSCRVTFKLPVENLPEDTQADSVALLGEFNSWEPEANPMTKRKDGSFSVTLSVDADNDYRFRYLVDGEVWVNDEQADRLEANRFGTQDCVLAL